MYIDSRNAQPSSVHFTNGTTPRGDNVLGVVHRFRGRVAAFIRGNLHGILERLCIATYPLVLGSSGVVCSNSWTDHDCRNSCLFPLLSDNHKCAARSCVLPVSIGLQAVGCPRTAATGS